MSASDLAIGIDLGTTNSAVAWMTGEGRAEILRNAEGSPVTPSVVQVQEDGGTLVGQQAKHETVMAKESTAAFFKRDMGSQMVYEYRGHRFTPVELSAAVLQKLKRDAEVALGRPIRKAVITVPAYFHDGPRVATQQAAQLAGLEVQQMINEPTAAALAYGLRPQARPQKVLVYDLGGGTFDISLAQLSPDGIDVLGTDGNHELGGKDWDDRIVQYVAEEFHRGQGLDPLDEPYTFQELLIRAEEAKKALSARERFKLTLNCSGRRHSVEISRQCFEDLTRDLLAQTEQLMDAVLGRAGCTYADLAGVLFVGGSSRMPMCANLVQRLAGREPMRSVNPDECVALGAAIQAAMLSGRQSGLRRVQDVTSHSLGMLAVSADGERYQNSILLSRNQPIPSRHVRPYQARTRPGNENSVTIYVTQGESEDPANCSFVGKYVVSGLIHKGKGQTVLDIAYHYDRSCVVEVSALQRGNSGPLRVERQPLPDDMGWIHLSPKQARGPRTVYLAVDLSGSMSGRPLEDAQKAMRGFLGETDLSSTRVGLLAFADGFQTVLQACGDANRLSKAVSALSSVDVGGGNSAHPFDNSRQLLSLPGERTLVVLTDGVWSCQPQAIASARNCHQDGIQVVALGFGSADEDFLRKIASPGAASKLESSAELTAAFGQIAQVLLEDQQGPWRLGARR